MAIMRRSSVRRIHTRTRKLIKRRTLKRHSSEGSIVIEAAILLPIVMLVFVFFVYLIQAAVISTALQAAASNAIKQAAAHMYPLALALDKAQLPNGGLTETVLKPPAITMKQTVEQLVQKYGNRLPSPVSEWINDAGSWAGREAEAAGEQVQAAVGQHLLRPLVERYSLPNVLKAERIRITHLKLPDMASKQNPYLGIQLEYDLPMRVPILLRKITLSARASERVWIGDSPIAEGDNNPTTTDKPIPQILSIEPEPLIPWKMAKLTAKVAPHEKVKLVVYYKSGVSVAQGLVWKTADADGLVSWEWNVSGNTTEGNWRLQVVTEDNRTADRSFEVMP